MLSALNCCHSVDREHVEALGSVSGSRWHERVTQQPEHQKSRRDVSVAAAAQSSPIHRTLGQVRTKGLLACWILYIYHLSWLLLLVSSTAIFWINKVNFFGASTGCF